MGLSAQAVAELEAERNRLLTQKREMEQALAGIDTLLRLAGSPAVDDSAAVVPPSNGDREAEEPTNIAELGLREAMRIVLGWHPRGLKPIEVTRELQRAHYPEKGATTLALRVSNDLNRMLKASDPVVERTSSGRYRLKRK